MEKETKMNNYTAVIPTLWKSERIFKLIEDLQNCDKIEQIIIIDNGLGYFNHYTTESPKLFPLIPKENIYVTAAWNGGVHWAKTQNIVILGDDANFDTKLFDIVTEEQLEKAIIGMDSNNYHYREFKEEPWFSLMFSGRPRPYGWGCILLFKKKNWLPIPENMKIWYNDDWILHKNPTPKLVLHNFPIETEMSTTSDSKEFDEIKKEDKLNYIRNLYD